MFRTIKEMLVQVATQDGRSDQAGALHPIARMSGRYARHYLADAT